MASQQPCGQEFASHTQPLEDLEHSWPAEHAVHVAPGTPHELLDWLAYASHEPLVPPLQQPLGHVFASHVQVPFVVSQSVLPHEVHAAPPVPHCVPFSLAYGTHTLPLQQPFGHEFASHLHAPPTHS